MKTAILIPIYKNFFQLNQCETSSFDQSLKILSNHEIILVCHKDIDFNNYYSYALSKNVEIRKEEFSCHFFENINGYNKLMLSLDFYLSFIQFDYILIYQLDAWIFQDDLVKWCLKNYDYIGAPWLDTNCENWVKLFPLKLKLKQYLLLHKYPKICVGNGGFSLRKIDSSINFLRKNKKLVQNWSLHEDVFWSFATFLDNNFKIPKYMEALKFSFELYPSKAYEMNDQELPMGCHAWEKYQPEFWSNYIDLNGQST